MGLLILRGALWLLDVERLSCFVLFISCCFSDTAWHSFRKSGELDAFLCVVSKRVTYLVVNPIIINGYASIFNCTTAVRASDSMIASSLNFNQWVGA